MFACLSQITMRNFWEKHWPCDGKYPTDFSRIGFHPIKRALVRFTGMLCLPHITLVTTSSCKLTSLLQQPPLPREENRDPEARAVASTLRLQPAAVPALHTALLMRKVQKAAFLSNYKKIYTCTGS